MSSTEEMRQLSIYKSLFRGREDVFALRWEKDGKSGYMPAYKVDWEAYRVHKNGGGSFKDFPGKTFQALTDIELLKHFRGEHFIGIYPLLTDNTSWFIAADFDEESWLSDSLKYIDKCKEYDLPAYLERSRSGNGGHVWIFFAKPYPAFKSRQIALALLSQSGLKSHSGDNSSFDRLFPNQNFHSGKGLGNLIALPLNRNVVEKGNGRFIDAQSLQPIEFQWNFLTTIKRVSTEHLDDIYSQIGSRNELQKGFSESIKLRITLDCQLRISRAYLSLLLLNYLKENLNFLNSKFFAKKKVGLSTWQTPARYETIDETAEEIIVPKGLVGKVLRFCKEQNIEVEFNDKRNLLKPITFYPSIQLKPFQTPAIEASRKKDIGIISAPPGSGKTVVALAIIAEKQQPTLIIVHRRQLVDQWIERIASFLKIPGHEIGLIGQSEIKIGSKITIAMVQSLSVLSRKGELANYTDLFGTVIIDECHHIPAQTYSESIAHLNSYYTYGLTATPFRRHNDEKLLFAHLGDVIAQINSLTASSKGEPTLIVRETSFAIPFETTIDKVDTLLKILIHDSGRNGEVIDDIKREVAAGRKALVITERKEHIAVFNQLLKQSCDVITLTGEDKESERKEKWKLLNSGDFEILITTGQLFGEGSDLGIIDCLFIVYPFAFEGKLIQYIGRVQRGELAPIIYDYHDYKVGYLHKLFLERNKHYNFLRKKGQLQENSQLVLSFAGTVVEIEGCSDQIDIKNSNLPASIAEFRPGIRWLIRSVNYKEEHKQLLCEVLDYNYHGAIDNSRLLFLDIKHIHFRSLETAGLLKSVVIRETSSLLIEGILDNSYSEIETIEEVIKVPIVTLEFGYGIVRFSYFSQRLYEQLFFEIENEHIRPEFEVLKPYFLKALKSKKIRVAIRLEIQRGKLISKTATSFDLEGLNETIIDGIKFKFVAKEIISNKSRSQRLLNLDECLSPEKYEHPLYRSEQNLLDDILKWKKVRHFFQLKYLAKRHDRGVIKIRFVLIPFSFVFFISTEKQYHIILETLDTEEATYIWHLSKDSEELASSLKRIDEAIIQLRSEGRQAYLDSKPKGFSRIIHDYSNPRKGFTLWKDEIEGKLQ